MVSIPMAKGLLKTKYHMPGLSKCLLTRIVPNRKLQEALNHKITIMTAPAGYGKTMAVLKWLENTSLPAAWLSIDANDNDILVFWRYFCAALESISAGILKDTEYVFESQELFNANVHLSIMIEKLSNTVSDFLFIIDDLHLIKNTVVYEGLAYFLTYMPSNMHLIMISRTEPRLKLARLGLKEDLVRIQANDLRFVSEEIAQFFIEKGLCLQEEEIKRIESYTEGWAAALVAVSLSLKEDINSRHVIYNLENCNMQIDNYLSEDVFKTWTKEQQEFMEKTAILDRLCGSLCEAVTDLDGDRLLKELFYQNSFLTALDDGGIWFRYHHLFIDYLRKRLIGRSTSAIQNLHLKAGKWLKENGYFNESIEHYLKGAHYKEALLLIEAYGPVLVKRREYSNFIVWIEKLPQKYLENSPMLMLIKTTYLIEINDYSSAGNHLEKLELAMNAGTVFNENVRTAYLMTKSNFYLRQGNLKGALHTIVEASVRGINTVANKDYLDINLYDISLYRTKYNNIFRMLRNNPIVYDSFVKHYRSLISKKPGYAPLIEGEFHYENERLDEALPKLLAAVDEAVDASCTGALVPAMITLAKIRRSQGDINGALETVGECERWIAKLHKPHWAYLLQAFKVRLCIDLNNNEMLDKWMSENRLSIYQHNILTSEYELIVLARVLIYQKLYDDAYILLTRLLNFAEEHNRCHSAVEILILISITAKINLNDEAAGKHLEKALSIGIEEGYVRSFVDDYATMVALLETYIQVHKKETPLVVYAKKLLSLTKKAVRHSMLTVGMDTVQAQLTPAEKKVLQLLIGAYTNIEISSELGITLRTVKAHTGNIYRKLGVKNRAQCIKKVGKGG